MKVTFDNYRNLNNRITIKCCGEKMVFKHGKTKYHNDNPFTARCKKCGRWFKGNQHCFDAPGPQHVSTTLEEVKRTVKK